MTRCQDVSMAETFMLTTSTSCWNTVTSSSARPRLSAGTSSSATSAPPHAPGTGLLSPRYCDTISPLWCKYLIKGRMLTKNTDGQLDIESFTTQLTCWIQENKIIYIIPALGVQYVLTCQYVDLNYVWNVNLQPNWWWYMMLILNYMNVDTSTHLRKLHSWWRPWGADATKKAIN